MRAGRVGRASGKRGISGIRHVRRDVLRELPARGSLSAHVRTPYTERSHRLLALSHGYDGYLNGGVAR